MMKESPYFHFPLLEDAAALGPFTSCCLAEDGMFTASRIHSRTRYFLGMTKARPMRTKDGVCIGLADLCQVADHCTRTGGDDRAADRSRELHGSGRRRRGDARSG